ncbi:NmrA family NAD(P)-binding protein [Kribbella sp. NPDC050124]|uniref:NmrA family NAD(P)-binding protein n=1 Tax=Kribbella sp. NPDC050124 TaxID=3364114 RepID=UPI00378A295B
MILVTAATAPVGRSIVEQLTAAGRPVRALTREPAKAGLPEAAELVAGDLNDPVSVRQALTGVSTVFLLAVVPGFTPNFLAAAKEAGVRRIVFQSSASVDDLAGTQPHQVAAFHHDVEQAIRNSGLEFTFLRLELSAANALQWAFDVPAQVKAGDVVRGPYAAAAGAPIHPADFAAIAIEALTDDAHAGRTYTVTGPESLTHEEQITLLGEAIGRPLRYEEMSPEAAREAMGPFAPADVLLDDWARHLDRPAPVTDTILELTGHPGRSFAQWASDHRADFTA